MTKLIYLAGFLVLLMCLCPSLVAESIDVERAQLGKKIRISDRALARDYNRLYERHFALPTAWLVYRIAEEESGTGLTLLASRLLQPAPAANNLMERQFDREMKLAILRELRFREAMGMPEVYARLLQQSAFTDVVEMAVLDAVSLDKDDVAKHVSRLAVGGVGADYPASSDLKMRQFALRIMVQHYGIENPLTIHAMRQAITHDHLLASLAALEVLPKGPASDGFVATALSRVLPAITAGRHDVSWVIAQRSLRRVRIDAKSPLMPALVQAVRQGGLHLAHAVVAGVREGRIALSAELYQALALIAKEDRILSMVLEDASRRTSVENRFKRIEDARARVLDFLVE